ncbi:DUF3592 domain-containing protein [Pseudonocardia acidicola]|uniref:DUF3592 domain-containing protein n=1 Tax=Pseudonocardia acidicola TaxID=2724939 RepID=A0ABX1SFN9_9PSEU|nr:DUF3592 domain-containing protein [Pseudonocardia acidicola]NMH99734.1 hypothetical protein [Pseudonocardia acidicola]
MTSSAIELIDELAGSGRSALRGVGRRLPQIVIGLALLLTALGGVALAGAALDDHAIDAHRVVTTADVLDGSSFERTLVRFLLPTGQMVVPERGVFYPNALAAGDTITIEYDAAKPELVRVAGRSVLDGLAPMGAGLLGVWVVLGPLVLWLRRRRAHDPA